MAKWFLEPGHTAAEFCVRHMMVTYVRGHFKGVHGTLDFDESAPGPGSVDVVIDARGLWTGETDRDAHLRSQDFLDVERFPEIRFRGSTAQMSGAQRWKVAGDLTLHGVAQPVVLDVQFLGTWQTPWWEGNIDKGPKTRAGFFARTSIDRRKFGVSWNSKLDRGGFVVGDEIEIALDAEAIRESD